MKVLRLSNFRTGCPTNDEREFFPMKLLRVPSDKFHFLK